MAEFHFYMTKHTVPVTYNWEKDEKLMHRQLQSNMKDKMLLERQQRKHLSYYSFYSYFLFLSVNCRSPVLLMACCVFEGSDGKAADTMFLIFACCANVFQLIVTDCKIRLSVFV